MVWVGPRPSITSASAGKKSLAVLEGGVSSVSLCPIAGLARELFTYEGCGTLFTLTDYCRVERLGIDDFHEVEKLLERGERERHLKARTPEEIGQLLLHGYGARLGTVSGDFAGFCALLPYQHSPNSTLLTNHFRMFSDVTQAFIGETNRSICVVDYPSRSPRHGSNLP